MELERVGDEGHGIVKTTETKVVVDYDDDRESRSSSTRKLREHYGVTG